MRSDPKALSRPEFIVLLAAMISITAMAIDIVIPGLPEMGTALNVANPNDVQLVIIALMLGLATGQIFAGLLSDSFGRKPVIYGGFVIIIAGSLLSMFAASWEMMLVGRVLQGLGCASPRIVTLALVRDGYEGRAMAQIMSIVMAVFIIVPAVAPAIGQGVLLIADWRAMFAVLIAMALISGIWLGVRQPETLVPSKRRPFSMRSIISGTAIVMRARLAVGYTLASGFIFGAFLAYLSTAQQVYFITFDLEAMFVVYFGFGALAIGVASVVNSMLVMRLGMRRLIWWALLGMTGLAIIFAVPVFLSNGVPPFWMFFAWLMASFLCVGILFGNMNARAMEPLGEIAGLGAALIGAISSFMSLPLAWAIGQAFDGGVTSLVLGFAGCGLASILVVLWTERGIPVSED